jgi:hypothetical protein
MMASPERRPRSGSNRVVRAAAATAGASLLALSLTVAAPTGIRDVAAAAGQLETRATATYSVRPSQHLVHVDVQATATNAKRDTATIRYFYVSAGFFIQPEATRITATEAGRTLATRLVHRTGYSILEVRFGRNLFHGQTIRIRIGYDLPGGAPRSSSDIRVESAFVSFIAWSFADVGTVRIDLPKGFEQSVIGGPMRVSGDSKTGQTLTATSITNQASWYAFITAERPEALTSTPLTLAGGEQIVIHGWPEDEEWQSRVGDRLQRGLPVLERLIGLPWPVAGELSVTERAAAVLEGYAGFYLTDEDRIEISEELDDLTIVHETSHAWFNQRLFKERWINEGLADTYATLTLGELGLTWEPIDRPNRTSSAAFPLQTWPPPGRIVDDAAEARERYGYDASYTVVSGLVREVTPARMRDVFSAADAGTIAYVGAPPPEVVRTQNDWRSFLDLLEEVGGSKQAPAVFTTWVLDADGIKELADRAAAREAYTALISHGTGWLPPLAVRSPMATWSFDRAREEIQAAERILSTRDSIVLQAGALGVGPPASLEDAYESATEDLRPIQAAADGELDTLATIADADRKVRAPRDIWMEIGLLGGIEPTARLDAAKSAFSADRMPAARSAAIEAGVLLDRAGDGGRNRVVAGVQLAVLVVLIVAALVFWRVRRRRRSARLAAAADAAVVETWTSQHPGWRQPPTDGTPPPTTWRPSPATWAPTPERLPEPRPGASEPRPGASEPPSGATQVGAATPPGGGDRSSAYGTLPANLPGEQRLPPATPAATPPEAEQGDDD